MESPQNIEYIGLKVSVARLSADRRGLQLMAGLTANQGRKVSPWSQLFRCAAFKVSSTVQELVGTTWLPISKKKKAKEKQRYFSSVLLHPGWLHWLHGRIDRFFFSMMLPCGWRSESSESEMQMYRNAKFPCAGREMSESLRRIDNAGGVLFRWNWSVGTGSESELVLNSHS